MGVDHGLGGKNGEKSRKRRIKKAKQVSTIAKGALNKKKEVMYDDAARVEYLSGFRKRKTERREYGHAMEILKTHKKKLDKRKEIRTAVNFALEEQKNKLPKAEIESDNDVEMADGDDEEENKVSGRATYQDEATTAMFGGAVDVVIDTGIADVMDRTFQESISDVIKAQNAKNLKKEPTKLEKALLKARQNLHNAPKKKKGFKGKKQEDADGLMAKALGPQGKKGKKKDKAKEPVKGRGRKGGRKTK
jgi:hypothetical protein